MSFRYYENRTGERFSALDGRLTSISLEIKTIASSINATVSHVQSMYKYINIESSSCQSRMGRHTEDLQVVTMETNKVTEDVDEWLLVDKRTTYSLRYLSNIFEGEHVLD